MKRIFKFKKTYSGLNYDMISVNLPLVIKICSINHGKDKMDIETHETISNIIEGIVREELIQKDFNGIYYYTFEFLKDIYESLNESLKSIGYYVVDIYVGDEKITDEANYIENINKYFENSKY